MVVSREKSSARGESNKPVMGGSCGECRSGVGFWYPGGDDTILMSANGFRRFFLF